MLRKRSKNEALQWYKALKIHNKIGAKECLEILCGYSYAEMGSLLTMSERIWLLYEKLCIERFDVEAMKGVNDEAYK